jgi:hypothetical protein
MKLSRGIRNLIRMNMKNKFMFCEKPENKKGTPAPEQ